MRTAAVVFPLQFTFSKNWGCSFWSGCCIFIHIRLESREISYSVPWPGCLVNTHVGFVIRRTSLLMRRERDHKIVTTSCISVRYIFISQQLLFSAVALFKFPYLKIMRISFTISWWSGLNHLQSIESGTEKRVIANTWLSIFKHCH